MKVRNLSIAAVGVLSVSAFVARAAEPTGPPVPSAHVPQTAAARSSAELLARAERAFRRSVSACASGDAQGLSDVALRDLRLEYELESPDSYSGIQGQSLFTLCTAIGGQHMRISNLWLFPTNDARSVFVQYEVVSPDTISHRQLALVEMRGARMARLVIFTGAPPLIVKAASAGRANDANEPRDGIK